ncbi:MAG: PstS family phosphate ABC transporter substrate-binding protein [Actinobacteria bacterium]|nr:PstS family phosphate ABC transporter substrate-binding protein [Actinomycetota bacterium]
MTAPGSRAVLLGLLVLLLGLAASGCGRQSADEAAAEAAKTEQADTSGDEAGETGAFEETLTGRVRADGSSTVGPFATAAAEAFRRENPDVRVSVGVSGTGGGFERFCAGETDLSNASRPIEVDERQACRKQGIEYVELQVASDGIAVVVNTKNDWVDCLSVAQLKRIWEPGSKIDNWRDLDPAFPDQKLSLSGPGTDSGTFDYFTGAIVGEEGKSRSDYSATEDDNVVVRTVSGDRGGLGYFGLSYAEENSTRLKTLGVGDRGACVRPSAETVQDGTYKPLSRPLFVYVKTSSLQRLEVETFVQFLLDNQAEVAKRALFVPLTDEQVDRSQAALDEALGGLG